MLKEEKRSKKNLERKEVKEMRRGLITTMLAAGLCLGLVLSVSNHPALASYGAYDDFADQLSSALKTMAASGHLSQWVHRQNGVVIETVTSDGSWTVYASGIQYRGYVYDAGQGKYYEQTLYYCKGAILQYMVTLKLVENEDGSYSQVGISRIVACDSIGQYDFEIEVEGDVDISALDPSELKRLVGLVTDGTPEEEVTIGDKTGTFKLVNLYLTGADMIELGDRVAEYVNSFGVEMGCLRTIGGTTWEMDAATFRSLFETTLSPLLPPEYSEPPEQGGWTEEEKAAFWQELYDQIYGHIDDAYKSGTGESMFEVEVVVGENPLTFSFKLVDNGDGAMSLKLPDPAGDIDTGITIQDYEFQDSGLIVGYDEDDNPIIIPMDEVTDKDLAQAQSVTAEEMLRTVQQSGVSAGDNALNLNIGEGRDEVDSSIPAELLYTGDLEAFKDYILGRDLNDDADYLDPGEQEPSPWRDYVDATSFTDDDWQELLDLLLQVAIDSDGDGYYDNDPEDTIILWEDKIDARGATPVPGSDGVYEKEGTTITLDSGQKVRFVEEPTGVRIEIEEADIPGSFKWVRHLTYSEVDEGQHTEVETTPYVTGHIVTGYTIIAGEDAGTSVTLDDPTVFRTRTEEVGVTLPLWGDPTALGTVGYDSGSDTLSMTVTRWKDEEGIWHDEVLTVTLDFSKIVDPAEREAVMQEFITAARDGSTLVCYGRGDTLQDGQIFYILGLGEH